MLPFSVEGELVFIFDFDIFHEAQIQIQIQLSLTINLRMIMRKTCRPGPLSLQRVLPALEPDLHNNRSPFGRIT